MGMTSYQPAPMSSGLDDLLGLGSDGLLGDVGGATSPPTVPPVNNTTSLPTSTTFGSAPPFGPPSTAPITIPANNTAQVTGLESGIFGFNDSQGAFSGLQTGYVAPKTVVTEEEPFILKF